MRRSIPVILAVLASAALVWIAARLDGGARRAERARLDSAVPLVEPTPLTAEERASARRPGAQGTVALEQGAWVQIAGPDGRLQQQYSATRLDPEPGAYLRMLEPRAVFYLEDGRVATLRAESGRVHVPNRALESGEFTGDVVIRLYRPDAQGVVNLAADSPAVILEALQLEFDAILNQVTCERAFRLTTDMLTFDGEGLDLTLAEDGRTIERLEVARALGPIVIDRRRTPLAAATGAPVPARDARASRTAAPEAGQPAREVADGRGAPHADPSAWVAFPCAWQQGSAAAGAPAAPAAPFYRLDLRDDVAITRYSPVGRADVRGDVLTVVLTLQSDLIAKESGRRADAATGDSSRACAASAGGAEYPAGRTATFANAPMAILASALGAAASPAAASLPQAQSQAASVPDDIIVIRYAGTLTLEPLAADAPRPASPGDIDVRIDGDEVLLADAPSLALRAGGVQMLLTQRIAENGARQATPRTLLATRGVEATDGVQTMWSEALQVTFAERGGGLGADATLGNAQVARAQATGGVQVALKDGARAFAAAIDGYPPEGRAELAGPDVAVVRAGVLLDGLAALSVSQRDRTVRSNGPGRARSWTEPLIAFSGPEDPSVPAPPQRADRPAPPESKPEFDAAWTGSMAYADGAASGAVLEVEGAVRVRAEPTPEEFNALDAAQVRIDFERAPGPLPIDRGAAGVDVRARKVVARGEARVENQVWPGSSREGEPRLFRLRGPVIEHDTVTADTSVPGPGDVLVHVPAGQARQRMSAQAEGPIPGGGIEGTSRFRWQGAMRVAPQPDGRHLMTMDGSVELVRAGIESADTMTLTCDRLEALLSRTEASAPERSEGRGTFGLGGSAEVLRVRGVGRCMVRTPQYDMECEEFDYDVRTQIAELRARPGRTVSVMAAGQVAPLRAAGVVWDLASGRVELRSASGTVGR